MSAVELTDEEVRQLRTINTYIEENIRASEKKGIDYIDPAGYKSRLHSSQNHVVFGRRGAGKTSLINQIESTDDLCYVYVDIETFKDISFPNIVLHVLRSILKGIIEEIGEKTEFYNVKARWFEWKHISRVVEEIENAIDRPDTIPTSVEKEKSTGSGLSIGNSTTSSITTSGSFESEERKQVKEEFEKDKIRKLLRKHYRYEEIVKKSINIIGEVELFVLLDDLYFVRKPDQPKLIDYFHKINKNTNVYLKVATIKNRSVLYTRREGTYMGTEIGHDIQSIDLDYTLDDYDNLKRFMNRLLKKANRKSESYFDNIRRVFAGDGFDALCMASGGVPRDFLSLFRACSDSFVIAEGKKIGVKQVREKAIDKVEDKKDYLIEDAGPESEILEEYVRKIREFTIKGNNTNAFLIAKEDLGDFPKSRQALMELVDMRLVHLLEKNTSKAPSDGRQYEAYMVDVGLYENTKPRDFTEVEPGSVDEKSRKRELRSSPVLPVSEIESTIRQTTPFDQFQIADQLPMDEKTVAE